MQIDYSTPVTRIAGSDSALSEFRGQVLLVVNTASACGYTPQYTALQDLYQRFVPHGFSVLGFPCNQFGAQEPGNHGEIASFCEQNYGVTFPLFAKIDVNGAAAHALFQQLKTARPGVLGTSDIKWNFTKFLVACNGEVLARYSPQKAPEQLAPAIQEALGGASESISDA